MNIKLRRTSHDDLDFVVGVERSAENRRFVNVWTPDQHLATLSSEDLLHLIVESTVDGRRVGYVIVAGVLNVNRSIEFRRIVIAEKRQGFGKEAVRLVKTLAFDELRAHRLWLDVKEHNLRARHVYQAEGFAIEGTLRECLKTDDGYESLVLMAILETEYRSGARPPISSGEDQARRHLRGSQSC
jgi:diamine N-acetyltransferase